MNIFNLVFSLKKAPLGAFLLIAINGF